MSLVEPKRSQSTTSLSRFYNATAANGSGRAGEDEPTDPKMDFCNAFWGQDNRGYDVVMARLRGAGRTIDELKAFWKERAAIEDDYAKRLIKLSKTVLGKDEIGDLAVSLQNVLEETAQQGQYHQALSAEIKTNVEQPTVRAAERWTQLKKGHQAQIEKSWRNKGLQEGHVAKAREKYESDCLKLNSYHANQALTQGKEADKLQSKLERVRQTIGQNEQDFRQFVRILEGTQQKWESEWKTFCDAAQDEEDERLAATKDIIWAYANAVSQVCVEDDSSCERIREKLEQFEPQNDMVAFVRGWGTGDQIPDPPRFINYSAGEYPTAPTSHISNYQRETSRPIISAVSNYQTEDNEEDKGTSRGYDAGSTLFNSNANTQSGPNGNSTGSGAGTGGANGGSSGLENGMRGVSLHDGPSHSQPQSSAQAPAPPPAEAKPSTPFGGVALPGMAGIAGIVGATAIAGRSASPAPPAASPVMGDSLPQRLSSMGPPPAPPTMTMPEPRVPSRQGHTQTDDELDPMAKALADLRRDPPPPTSVRRNPSHQRRPESTGAFSQQGSLRGQNSSSPAPGAGGSNRMSFQAPSSHGHGQAQPGGGSSSAPGGSGPAEFTLSPPAPGHTAAQLQRSMDDFHRRTDRTDPRNDKRGSVSYNTYGDDVVGAHPSSRPASPSPSTASAAARAPSPAMMQPFSQPATHIADEVLSQYHQAFPGERNERAQARSRAGSVASHRSGGSFVPPMLQQQQQQDAPVPREGFVGIGAGRASPAPPGAGAGAGSNIGHGQGVPSFASPGPSPVVGHGSGNLGPQNMGIKLDASGGVAQDSMAEAYRRQYQEQQGGGSGRPGSFIQSPPLQQSLPPQHQQQQQQQQRNSFYAGQPQSATFVTSPTSAGPGPGPGQAGGPPPIGQRPTSGYGAVPPQQQHPHAQHAQSYASPSTYAPPVAFATSPQPAHSQPPQQYGSHRSQSSYSGVGGGGGGGYSNAAAPPAGYAPGQSQGQSAYPQHPPPQQQQQQQAQGYGGYGQNGANGSGPATGGYQNRSVSPAPGPAPQLYSQQSHQSYGRSASPAPFASQGQGGQGAQGGQGYHRGSSPAPGAQPQSYGYSQQGHGQAQGSGQYGGGYQPQQPHQQPQQQRSARTPSPQPGVAPQNAAPTGQWSTTGLPVLFYVKALYDYQATSGAEFDFQAGDIIAVTATPEDGWWSGELLDEARRLPGRTDFPSNFVCLF